MHRYPHRLARDHVGSNPFHSSGLGRLDWALAIQGSAQGINHAPNEVLPNRNLDDASGASYFIPLFDLGAITKDHGPHTVLL